MPGPMPQDPLHPYGLSFFFFPFSFILFSLLNIKKKDKFSMMPYSPSKNSPLAIEKNKTAFSTFYDALIISVLFFDVGI
jgi:hypothetical protein